MEFEGYSISDLHAMREELQLDSQYTVVTDIDKELVTRKESDMKDEEVIAEFKNVSVVLDDGEPFVTDVRLVEVQDVGRWLYYGITCSHCEEVNWIVMGTDRGDYRCTNCTDWL